jgi:hypothetical protein
MGGIMSPFYSLCLNLLILQWVSQFWEKEKQDSIWENHQQNKIIHTKIILNLC